MKKLFIAVLAVAALASCAQDEIITKHNQVAIDFSNGFVDNSTKAIDTTYGNGSDSENGLTPLKKFNVYGTATGNKATVQVFNGTQVSGNIGDQLWSYTGTQYWIENATYKFVGVVDATVDAWADSFPTQLGVTNENDALVSQVVEREQKGTIDASPVALSFKHLLAKAHFTFTDNDGADNYTFKVTNIVINDVYVSGTYTIDGGAWSGLTKGDVQFGTASGATAVGAADTAVVIASDGTTSHLTKLIVPATYTNLVVNFDVELLFNGGPFQTWTETVTIPTVTLAANHSYNFAATLVPGKKIDFKVVSLDGWVDAPNVDADNVQ